MRGNGLWQVTRLRMLTRDFHTLVQDLLVTDVLFVLRCEIGGFAITMKVPFWYFKHCEL